MNLFLDTINSIAPFATIASTILITYVLYKKTASEKAIVKGIKIDKKENLNLGYAEKIIIEIDELENNVNELINSNLEALKDILAEVKK